MASAGTRRLLGHDLRSRARGDRVATQGAKRPRARRRSRRGSEPLSGNVGDARRPAGQLRPGQAMSQYHWEADQEDFLVLAGQALLIIEGEERPLRAWDLIHLSGWGKSRDPGRRNTSCIVMAVGLAITRQAPTGAHIPSTLPPCDIAPGSGEKRLSRRKPTRGCLGESRWRSTLTGCPSQRSELLFRSVAGRAAQIWLPLRRQGEPKQQPGGRPRRR